MSTLIKKEVKEIEKKEVYCDICGKYIGDRNIDYCCPNCCNHFTIDIRSENDRFYFDWCDDTKLYDICQECNNTLFEYIVSLIKDKIDKDNTEKLIDILKGYENK